MNDDLIDIEVLEEKDITPKDLLKFARQILSCIAIMFILSWLAEWLIPGRGIFECCKTILPSITTLIIGYYFGKS